VTAYVIYLRERVLDQVEIDLYRQMAPAARAGHSVKRLAFYGDLDTLEGEPFLGAAVLTFPSMAEARAWYDSSAYQEAAAHRRAGAQGRMFIIDGID
jgi:uncharacterized protein (DUF1330 family)